MTEFEDALRKSVHGLGESYKAAERDLFEEVVEASRGVVNVTGGHAELDLRKSTDGEEGTVFTLYLASENSEFEIALLTLSADGYPIKIASSGTAMRLRRFEAVVADRGQLKDYFTTVASRPDSRLVLRIAYLMRTGVEAQ